MGPGLSRREKNGRIKCPTVALLNKESLNWYRAYLLDLRVGTASGNLARRKQHPKCAFDVHLPAMPATPLSRFARAQGRILHFRLASGPTRWEKLIDRYTLMGSLPPPAA